MTRRDENRGLATAAGWMASVAGGAALGAGLMYVLDPERGARRRAMARDKVVHLSHKTSDAMRKTAEYTRNYTKGFVAEARARLSAEPVDDERLMARVRSALGRAVSHPSSIEVNVRNGVVSLGGPVLAEELPRLMRTVEGVRGVRKVVHQLEVRQQAGSVPGLQGGIARTGRLPTLGQAHWPPPTRLAIGAAGGGLAVWGVMRRDWLGAALGLAGLTMIARAWTNKPLRQLLGVRAGAGAVTVQKTINIRATVDRVFDFLTHPENFPYFMSNVREVRDLGGGRKRWVVAGPAGVPVEWDAQITQCVANEVLAWESLEGAMVANAGVIHFQPNPDGSTRVDIRLTYTPPAGALGHAIARLFGSDPKSEMDQDLLRVKTMIETGHPPRDAAQPVATSRQRRPGFFGTGRKSAGGGGGGKRAF